ncbi:MAG: hypothetical protein AVDCRST_MAG68-1325 [uncultured Gemmatimonadetes bacterium]|uniref:DUF305 domain-containing protein n=1 Tax=uncultured Gemmatimonadota bacterium TaxID=203437 RepID=A0A6J4KS22_9BACT|nr:MAG: hypothetical protein AVDCRST_MAG68-1325 [uncultured Gemmatimonadota bacterium]
MGMKRLAIRTGLLAAALAAWVTPGAAQGHGHSHGAARADTVIRQWTPADAHFMSAMIGHHAQAVQMARLAPTHAASPAVRRLAARIISAQQDEIATMQRWLRDRGQPVPDSAGGMHGHGAHAMPGMLSEAQMRQLGQARGAAFDELFLKLMIQHHRGAVAMVSQLFGTHGAGQDETVFKFASDVNVDQVTEIARMEDMLVALVFGES